MRRRRFRFPPSRLPLAGDVRSRRPSVLLRLFQPVQHSRSGWPLRTAGLSPGGGPLGPVRAPALFLLPVRWQAPLTLAPAPKAAVLPESPEAPVGRPVRQRQATVQSSAPDRPSPAAAAPSKAGWLRRAGALTGAPAAAPCQQSAPGTGITRAPATPTASRRRWKSPAAAPYPGLLSREVSP